MLPTCDGSPSRPAAGLSLPPPGIYVPGGPIMSAARSAAPFPRPAAAAWASRAQKSGLIYQTKVEQRLLRQRAAVDLRPWFRYIEAAEGGASPRWCQPDVLLDGGSTIVEIKTRWMDTAWWQLARLYRPVIERAFNVRPRCVAIVRSYDPAVAVPGPVRVIDSFDAPLGASEIGVMIWR